MLSQSIYNKNVACRMISAETIKAFTDSTSRLSREIGRFSTHDFNAAVNAGWSAGQIAEHLLLTDIAVFRVLQGEVSFAARKTDQKVDEIKKVWTNRSEKLEAIPGNMPSDMLKDPVSMKEKIMRERNLILHFLNSVEEDSLCISRPHRFHGELTISEWVWFMIFHTDRHIEQLKEIEIQVVN